MIRALVTGVKGQLGYDVVNELKRRGYEAIGCDVDEMDITDKDAVCSYIKAQHPTVVVHCAAYTAVDKAESCQDICRKVNVDGVQNIADVCKELDIPMMYFSTDYVFTGEGERPWEPDDAAAPLNFYGLTKWEGEQAVRNTLEKYFIIRISWVFGVNGHNFIKTMLKLSETHDTLRVVDDQVGSPTYTYDLARLVVDMLETDKYGTYHASNEGYCSWDAFAREIFRQAGKNTQVISVSTEEYGLSAAKRPANSRMDKSKLDAMGFKRLPSWQDALARYLKEL